MSDIEVRAIDVHDEEQLHEWWRVGREEQVDRAYDVYPAWEHSRVALVEENPEHDLVLLAAYQSGAMVGIGLLGCTCSTTSTPPGSRSTSRRRTAAASPGRRCSGTSNGWRRKRVVRT